MDAVDAIHARTSVRRFRPDPVPRALVEELLDCAVRAPNHKLTEPWRFVVLTGRARERFAELRGAHRLRRFADPASPEALEAAERVRRETAQMPVIVVAMCAVSDDPITREEDYAATMMALAQFMVAASARGLGTYLRTGGLLGDPALAELVRLPPDHRIVGFVALGYSAEAERPRRRIPAAERTEWLD